MINYYKFDCFRERTNLNHEVDTRHMITISYNVEVSEIRQRIAVNATI